MTIQRMDNVLIVVGKAALAEFEAGDLGSA